MADLPQTGKILIIAGALLILAGLFLVFSGKMNWPGRLPGDILIKKENFTFYFPLASGILLSILVSLILYLLRRFL